MASRLSEEVTERRNEELEALKAYYDDALSSSISSPSSITSSTAAAADTPQTSIQVEGPWLIQLSTNKTLSGGVGIPTLEIRLPPSYPFDEECPTPILHNVMMNPSIKQDLLQELRDMYEVDVDVGILWGERCREEISMLEETILQQQQEDNGNDEQHSTEEATSINEETRTFIPPTTRYNQPIRNFPLRIIDNPMYQREILHTAPFHPPKSGPAETMIAHVCQVNCIEHVQWALAELLFNDKKVAKATHNMFAYRFYDDGDSTTAAAAVVHDNDDDGEKGSGAKLASLLELSGAENVLVVVSRWYGGVLLGSARFKWIAGVARTGLVQGGFIND